MINISSLAKSKLLETIKNTNIDSKCACGT